MKCLEQYVGSATKFKTTFRIHKSDIKTKKDRCRTARHFNNKCLIPPIPLYIYVLKSLRKYTVFKMIVVLKMFYGTEKNIDTKDVHKSSLNVFWTSYAHPTYCPCPDGCTKTHIYIWKMCQKNNLSCRSRTPGTPGPKSYAQIANNYQSLTRDTKTYIPEITGHVDALVNLTVIKKHI